MPFGSSRIPCPFATNVRATVKWYNPTKGFGFVLPDDGSADVFLHASVVEQAGLQTLDEGLILVCDLADGQKGAQVSAIHSVEASSAPAQREVRGPGRRPCWSCRTASWDGSPERDRRALFYQVTAIRDHVPSHGKPVQCANLPHHVD